MGLLQQRSPYPKVKFRIRSYRWHSSQKQHFRPYLYILSQEQFSQKEPHFPLFISSWCSHYTSLLCCWKSHVGQLRFRGQLQYAKQDFDWKFQITFIYILVQWKHRNSLWLFSSCFLFPSFLNKKKCLGETWTQTHQALMQKEDLQLLLYLN